MPAIVKQSSQPRMVTVSNGKPTTGLLSGVVSATELKRAWMKVLLYGRNRVGKSRLSAEWPKRLLAIACEPRENGGADTLLGMKDIDVAWVGLKPVPSDIEHAKVTGTTPLAGTEKIHTLLDEMASVALNTGSCPYQTVTIDVSALQDICLAEVMGWDSVDVTIKRPRRGETGGVGRPQFGQRAEKCIQIFRKLKDLPCHVIFIGQEKDHNPTKDEDGNVVGGKMVVSAQEKSFMSVYLGEASALWLQNACPNIHQLYMDAEVEEVKTTVDMAGTLQEQTVKIQTGRYIRRLRCTYHPNYAAGITAPDGGVPNFAVPEYIEAATPKEMYEALVKVSQGIRVKEGKYL